MKAVPALALLLMSLASLPGRVAYADTWLVAETPAAVAVSDAQAGVFKPGVMPAVGAYADNGWLALGLRLRTGVLRDGDAPGRNFKDPSLGSLTTASLAARVHKAGAWVEGAVGGGFTGEDLVPAAELGMGWAFDLGSFEMGPSLRVARVSSMGEMDTLGSADLVLLGVDMRFGKDHAKRPNRSHRIEAPVAIEEVAIAIDRDNDTIVEREPSCAQIVDGCTFGAITIVDDRIVLDERVLFDFERARVKTAGRELIEQIALLWSVHPEWKSITIEGHADVRGSDEFNLELSLSRAKNVRKVLVEAGFGAVNAIGYGRSRPRETATTEQAHQRNRRVEFVIERRVEEFK